MKYLSNLNGASHLELFRSGKNSTAIHLFSVENLQFSNNKNYLVLEINVCYVLPQNFILLFFQIFSKHICLMWSDTHTLFSLESNLTRMGWNLIFPSWQNVATLVRVRALLLKEWYIHYFFRVIHWTFFEWTLIMSEKFN